MQYELAQELKEAGFPQAGNGRFLSDPNRIVMRAGDRAYAPTLEELIEACHTTVFRLISNTIDGTAVWSAEGENSEQKYLGSPPSEAVARLWLALGKRS